MISQREEKTKHNILKSRDDNEPVIFEPTERGKFTLKSGTQCSWLQTDEEFGPEKLRPRVEPWLTALFQSEHLALLVGSGLTHAVHNAATGERLHGMEKIDLSVFETALDEAAASTAQAAGRDSSNIEDQIRVANELLRGLEHLCLQPVRGVKKMKRETAALRNDIERALTDFASSILEGERSVAIAPQHLKEQAFGYLVNFLVSFSGRSGTRDRLHIFTTNYDRLIEAGAEVAGLHLVDRFVGSLAPVFRSTRLSIDLHYNPPGIRGEPRYLEGVSRFTKLHGSVDWIYVGRKIRRIGLPFGAESIAPYLHAPELRGATSANLMIYPNSAKDRETASYPYVDLFRDFAAAICRPNSTLVTFGYSFGDEHINRVIEDMLTIPSTHLVVISFDDPMGRIMRTYREMARPAQVTLLIGNHIGSLDNLVTHYLPKSAIDRTTFRMAELLRSRFSNDDQGDSKTGESVGGERNDP